MQSAVSQHTFQSEKQIKTANNHNSILYLANLVLQHRNTNKCQHLFDFRNITNEFNQKLGKLSSTESNRWIQWKNRSVFNYLRQLLWSERQRKFCSTALCGSFYLSRPHSPILSALMLLFFLLTRVIFKMKAEKKFLWHMGGTRQGMSICKLESERIFYSHI